MCGQKKPKLQFLPGGKGTDSWKCIKETDYTTNVIQKAPISITPPTFSVALCACCTRWCSTKQLTGVFDTSRFRGAWSQIIISCFFDPLDPFLCGACPHWAVCKFQSFWRRSVPPKVLCCAYRELLPWNFWHIRFHPVVRLGTWMYKIFLRNYKISRHDDPSQKPIKKSPKILWENTYSDEYLFAPIPLKEWMNLFSPEMTADKNAGKQTWASKEKNAFIKVVKSHVL